MKLKGINPIEQHAEKIVLALVSVVFLVVLTMQFLLQPNSIESGGQTLPPGNVYANIRTEADRLVGQMEDASPSLPEFGDTPDLAERFTQTVVSREAHDPLPLAMGPSFDIDVAPVEIDTSKPIAPMAVPAPKNAIAAPFIATVDPYALEDMSGLSSYVDTQPYDLRSVTVEAAFNGDAFRLMLEGDGIDEDLRPMTPGWWRQGVSILAIETERERLLDPKTDTWGETTTVRTAPGSPDLIDEASADWASAEPTPEQLMDLVATASRRGTELLEPAYYPLIAGPAWTPPSQRGSVRMAVDRSYRIIDLARRINQLEGEIEAIEQGGEGRATSRTTSVDDRSGRGGRSGGQTDDSASRTAAERSEVRREQQLAQLSDRLQTLNDEFNELEPTEDERFELDLLRAERNQEQLVRSQRTTQRQTRRTGGGRTPAGGFSDLDPGFSDLRDPRGGDPRRGSSSRGGRSIQSDILYDDSVRFWVHDLDVEPGAIYRYRTRVVLNNPMYGRDQMLGDQAELGEDPLAYGDWSEWTNPVRVDPELYFFVNAASDRGQLTLEPLATVEMYRFWYGYWRRGDSNFRPGMPLEVTPENARLAMPVVDTSAVEDPGAFFDYAQQLEEYRLAYDAWREAQERPTPRDPSTTNPGGRNPSDDLRPSSRPGTTTLAADDPGEEPEPPEELEGVEQVRVGRLFSDLYLMDIVSLPFPQPPVSGEIDQKLALADEILARRAEALLSAENDDQAAADETGAEEGDDDAEASEPSPEPVLERWEVVFVGPDGRFIRRNTSADQASPDYRRLWLSARHGERQGLDISPVGP